MLGDTTASGPQGGPGIFVESLRYAGRIGQRRNDVPWEHAFNEALSIIEVTLTGVVSGDELRQGTERGLALSRTLGEVRCIIDATDQEETGTILDLYQLPDLYERAGLDRKTRLALLPPTRPELRELAMFYETVCVNRGWLVRLFTTREQAIEWLRNGPEGASR